MAYKTGNPVLSEKVFKDLPHTVEAMTLDGTVNKTFLMLLLLVATAAGSWIFLGNAPILVLPAVLIAFVIAIVLAFKPRLAPTLAPAYAVFEGVAVGIISSIFNTQYEGIVLQAISLTISIAFVMLLLYKSQIIKATENFKLIVTSATLGIALLYLVDIGLRFFGNGLGFISGGGTIGIGFSLFVVGLAALNLVMDFDFIEQGADNRAPKYMEWYGAFGLMVTLVWLYLELLRLLAKTRR